MEFLQSPSHAADMVGSQSGVSKPPPFVTNCITYVIRVLNYAFAKTNQPVSAKHVSRLGERGTELAKYLVRQGWTAVFCNPDISHPADGDDEHITAYRTAKKQKTYYRIPVKYQVLNYNPTATSNPNYRDHWGMSKAETIKDLTNLNMLRRIKFAYGLSRGGRHTWLYSYGRVYEVHWDNIGSGLYDSSPFETYEWLSSLVVIPPDAISERLQDMF